MLARLKTFFPCCFLKRLGCVILVSVYWYVAAYALMMDWHCPAYDPASQTWASESHYRMAHTEVVVIDFTTVVPEACWANRLFWPIDALLGWVKSTANIKEIPPVVLKDRQHRCTGRVPT